MLGKILDLLEKTLKLICTVFMGAIAAMLSYAVIMRYVFHMPPAWSMELGRYMFLWMVMLCAALVTREQSHIQMQFMVNLMPPKLRFAWLTIIRVLMIAFCWILIEYGMRIYPIVGEASSPTLNISMGYMYLSVPMGGLLMALFLLEIIVRSFRARDWARFSEG
jgi:TRAP-type C4-dicarboxylate transport system permease small subunit